MTNQFCCGRTTYLKITDHDGWYDGEQADFKRPVVVCPDCKRKLMAKVYDCGDSTEKKACLHMFIPPHKPKAWWKKGKARRVNK